MENSADPGQLLFQKPTDLDLHCLQNRVYPGSAGQGLILNLVVYKLQNFLVHFSEIIRLHISYELSAL